MDFIDWQSFGSDLFRLVVAVVFGGLLGLEREIGGHFAGLRTHMMVAAGACVFIITGATIAGEDAAAMTRVVQGVATGVGFLGAGTILKLSDRLEIKGLTTASTIWLSAAVGTAVGLAEYELAAAGLCVSLFVLGVLGPMEKALARRHNSRQKNDE
jgi:putative Mg2+ transporter-C (MgtC) family protein